MTLAAVALVLSIAQNDSGEISYTTLTQGDRFFQNAAFQALVTTSRELEDHWKKLFPNAPARPVPKVDFDKEAVAIVSLGVRPHSGFAVSVTKIVRAADAIRISFRETLPDPEKKHAQALTHPFVIVRTAKPDRKVEFVKDPK